VVNFFNRNSRYRVNSTALLIHTY